MRSEILDKELFVVGEKYGATRGRDAPATAGEGAGATVLAAFRE